MTSWKTNCVILFVLAATLFALGEKVDKPNSCKKVLAKKASSLSVEQIGDLLSKARYEVCVDEGKEVYHCPGGKTCCTPGDPASKCCPADHPLCINSEYCCKQGYPKLCGPYCCKEDSFCCNKETCCEYKGACCGAQCCPADAPCCKEGKTPTCCDKDTMGCCAGGYGCVSPCPSQFDAIGCELSSLSLDDELLEAPYALPKYIYRILRLEENPDKIVAKDPRAQRTVLSHVNCGSRPKYTSQFISTSASLDVAKKYKKKGEDKGLTGLRICKFEVDKLPTTCQIVDLTTDANRDRYLGNAVCKNFAKASEEVLLQCAGPIPCTVIDPPPKGDSKTFVDTKHEL
ncbi:uncharacterized protein [Acropora muricata]|uniref:uncharacterized protein n=1 Tax=Acropora muricata TaxID=159855 RepID=UPI0034E45E17